MDYIKSNSTKNINKSNIRRIYIYKTFCEWPIRIAYKPELYSNTSFIKSMICFENGPSVNRQPIKIQ